MDISFILGITDISTLLKTIKTWLPRYWIMIKCIVSGLRQCLVTKSLLKMMKNALYFTLKAFCSYDI